MKLENLLKQIRKCTLCHSELMLGANPIIRAAKSARILIIGQAPGTRVHETGIPWNDRSGDRIRAWLNLEKPQFYDTKLIAIMPMGFCYPGVDKHGGDKPPRRECAPAWHAKVLERLPNIRLTLLVGSYAQRYYLKDRLKATMSDTVKTWRSYLPDFFPLPHPSWRNTGWLKRNPWFEETLLPELRIAVQKVMSNSVSSK